MITFVCTSCGRWDLLEKTLRSFLRFNTFPVDKYIIIDNPQSSDPFVYRKDSEKEFIKNIFPEHEKSKVEVILNETNYGQVISIDLAYSMVDTKYIFHCEDDWEFYNSGFIESSLVLLHHDPKILNVNIRERNNGEKGSEHPILAGGNVYGIEYNTYMPNYCGVYHGFSWNPGLRRKSDYGLIAPFKKWGNEEGMNYAYQQLGFYAVCTTKSYCRHIGEHSSTPLRNQ